RYVGGDELALALAQRGRTAEQHLRQLTDGLRRVLSVLEKAGDAGQTLGQFDVRHGYLPSPVGPLMICERRPAYPCSAMRRPISLYTAGSVGVKLARPST